MSSTADPMKWFKHDSDSLRNRKIRKVVRTHGPTGYAIWFAVLEKLYAAEGDFQIVADELWLEDLADDLKISDYRTLIRVLDTFADVGLISSQLWQGEHLIHCPAIQERGDSYVQKRAKEAEKKRVQRANKKADVPQLSPGDKTGTRGQMANVPPADPDLRSQISDPEVYKDLLLSSKPLATEEEKTGMAKEGIPDAFRDWMSGVLPVCKTGSGPNDWHEPSVQIILTWLRTTFGPEKTRGDAIAYISKRNHPDRDEYPALLARLEEGLAAQAKAAKAAQSVAVAPVELPADPPPGPEVFESMRKKIRGVA